MEVKDAYVAQGHDVTNSEESPHKCNYLELQEMWGVGERKG
jgi:hypothetical protein